VASGESEYCEAGSPASDGLSPARRVQMVLDKTALNFAIYGRARPGKTAVSTAVTTR
jgi:hypothetical protein